VVWLGRYQRLCQYHTISYKWFRYWRRGCKRWVCDATGAARMANVGMQVNTITIKVYYNAPRRMWSFDRNYRTRTRRTFCMLFFLTHYPGNVLLLAMTMMIFITVKSRCRYPPNSEIGRSLSIKPEFSAPWNLPSLLHTFRQTHQNSLSVARMVLVLVLN
jgi:hypothetical protein